MVDLMTVEGENLKGQPWQVYPRPQMRRDSYLNLNGEWDFQLESVQYLPSKYDKKILVPFCPESKLSGVGERIRSWWPNLYYRRCFSLPEGFMRGRVLLHIGAADQHLTCYINGKKVGKRHSGGYENITYDITQFIEKENKIEIRCTDNLSDKTQPYGKQTLNRGGMWYTPVSGIWQTVWLESVPETYIHKLNIENRGASVTISTEPALDGKVTVAGLGEYALVGGEVSICPENPHFWSPEDPYLYDFTVEAGEDRVDSYFALRTLEIKKTGNYQRLCLNGKP